MFTRHPTFRVTHILCACVCVCTCARVRETAHSVPDEEWQRASSLPYTLSTTLILDLQGTIQFRSIRREDFATDTRASRTCSRLDCCRVEVQIRTLILRVAKTATSDHLWRQGKAPCPTYKRPLIVVSVTRRLM